MLAVMVLFDKYYCPTPHDSTVPVATFGLALVFSVHIAVTHSRMGCKHTHIKRTNTERGT